MKAAIFDMDGLLINSEPLWDEVDTVILKKRGYSPSREIFKQRLGIGEKATMDLYKKTFNIPDNTSKLISERQELFSELFDKNPQFMPGAVELIKFLASKKLNLGIATGGHIEKRVKKILGYAGLEKYFNSITTSHEVSKGKPAPDIFLLEANKLKVDPIDCLVFEDAPGGVEAGKNALMNVIGVNANKQIQEKLKEKNADNVFASLVDVTPTILATFHI